MDQMQKDLAALTLPLLDWYGEHRRSLPWRDEVSPYRTWVSEIMLQQTRVTAVLPYFARFMEELPTVEALAKAPEERLLKLWEGLGYYSRARNLQKAAQQLVEQHGGEVPADHESLLALPGIGEYTAGAIASIAFGQAVPAVDGNVLRVAARIMGDGRDILDPALKKEYTRRIAAAMSREAPGDYNQALMDLGATVCLPNGMPLCESCPAADFCRAHQRGEEALLPLRRGKKPRRREARTVFVLQRQGKIALHRRGNTGLLARLWEFPQVEGSLSEKQAALQLQRWGLKALDWNKCLQARHIFSHVEWEMTGYSLAVKGEGAKDWRWVDEEEYAALAIPSAFARFDEEARRIFAGEGGDEDDL